MIQNKHYKRWFYQATIGIIIFGAGLCMLMEVTMFKHTNPPTWQWVGLGTLTLCVVMTGIILMIDSVRFRIKYELEKNKIN